MKTTQISKQSSSNFAIFLDAAGTIFRQGLTSNYPFELIPDATYILNLFKERKIDSFPIKTGLITNWGAEVIDILKEFKIDDCFDFIMHHDVLHKGKPDRSVFLYACQQLKINHKTAIHIGDSFYDDILGAQNAGLHGIWICQSNDFELTTPLSPLLIYPPCNNFHEVVTLVEKIISKR